jgi:hypothetical protein
LWKLTPGPAGAAAPKATWHNKKEREASDRKVRANASAFMGSSGFRPVGEILDLGDSAPNFNATEGRLQALFRKPR